MIFNAMIEVGDSMNTRKKKKIRVKWKNFIFLIIILFLIVFIPTRIVSHLKNTTKKEEPVPKEKTTKSEKEKKLEELNHIDEQIDYWNEESIDRYIAYKRIHPELEMTQVIKEVNMNLDQTPYENILPARNTNTENVLVNKYYYLEKDYVPDNLEPISRQYALSNMRMVDVAKEAFEQLSSDAKKNNLNIIAMSTYRSYSYQVDLYKRYVKQDGEEKADTYSGRPGHSEHQTGLAVDVYNKVENYINFERTKEFSWMQEHAHEYGFILRFPKEKENETGYSYESWHYRYVGVEAATYIHENNISFEEYYATKIKDW